MTTTIFDGYDEEYRTLSTDISTKMREIASYEDQKGPSLQCLLAIEREMY